MRTPSPLRSCVRAEFLKICALRFPTYGCAGLVLFLGLITYEILIGERLADHVDLTEATALLPHLAMATWGKLVILPVFFMSFATYCTSVDSQYGMIRVGCSQPISRSSYVVSKTAAILLHTALFTSVYFFLLLVVSAISGRSLSLRAVELAPILNCYLRLLVFCVSFTWLAVGAALFRKTLLESFVSVILTTVMLTMMNMLPIRFGLNPFLFSRYFLHPLVPIVPRDWLTYFPNTGCPMWQYLLTMIATPAIVWGLALTRFVRRDIVE